jgi:hypothetical protein
MSERHDPATTPGGGAAPDPLARIGARLIEAAQVQRRRRIHARQRLAGVALTLLLVAAVAALVAASPFGGGGAHQMVAGRAELPAGDGRLAVWGGSDTLCVNRPDSSGPAGTTICGAARLLEPMPPGRIAWAAAHRDGDTVVVTGLTTRDVSIVASGERAGAAQVTAQLGEDDLAVPGTGLRVVPFTATLRGVEGDSVRLVAEAATTPRRAVEVVAVDGPAYDLDGWATLTYHTPDGATPALVELVQQRLAGAGIGAAKVVGSGPRLVAQVEIGPEQLATMEARMRAALAPGSLQVVDWEASALLPDGRTVADGIARGSARAITVSRVPDASHALTRAKADAQAVRLGDGARVVQALDHIRIPQPAIDDPRARFFVVRVRDALTNSDLRTATTVTRDDRQQVELRFDAAGRERLHALTRTLAQRGRSLVRPGRPLSSAAQRLAVIIDGRVVSLDPVDPARDPDGLDGGRTLLSGPFSGNTATELATNLRIGPLRTPLIEETP